MGVCQFLDQMLADSNPDINDPVATQNYLSHYPSGSSLRELEHITQCVRSKNFQRFDFGPLGNLERYGSSVPPTIDISTIDGIPIAIFAGEKDLITKLEDTQWAMAQLTKSLVHYSVHDLGHVSYFIARDMSYFSIDVMDMLFQFMPLHKKVQELLD